MVALRKQKGIAHWFRGVWVEPAHALDFSGGPFLWRRIPAVGFLVRESREGRILAKTCYCLDDRASRVRVFPADRPAVSVCSVRDLDGHVRSLLCIGAP